MPKIFKGIKVINRKIIMTLYFNDIALPPFP